MNHITFEQLEKYHHQYKENHETAYALFEACVVYARRLAGANNADADDIAYASAWKAWARFNTLPATQHFNAWYTRLVRNQIRDVWRKNKTRYEHEEQDMFSPPPAFSPLERFNALETSGEHRDLIEMLLDGHTIGEAANRLGISTRTAKRRLHNLKGELCGHV